MTIVVVIEPAAVDFPVKYRAERITTVNHRNLLDSKESRTARQDEMAVENDQFEEVKGIA